MDKTTERARAWHRYRRERKPFAYVEPGLEGTFMAGVEAGIEIGRALERETLQVALPSEATVGDS